ncbi:MAG: response regulator [Pseudomonadota bacterium]
MHSILVIDDETPTLTMFRLFLGAYGHTVFTATSGEEGLAVFAREHPPLVITDIRMPQMQGIEVLRRIKEIAPQTEVIVITGHGDMDLAIQALNLDATDFINKPIQRQALDQALKRAEERMRLARNKQNEIDVRAHGDAAVIDIQGRFNSGSETHIDAAYTEALALMKGRIVINFSENATINGAGLAVLAQLLLAGRKKGHPVAVVAPSINFSKVFDIVGISKLASVFDSEQAALLGPL